MLNKSMYARIKNCQRGAVIVLFALMLPVLFGFMGLSIDVGLAYVEKGKVQDIADSAALAGAAHLADEGDRLDAIEAAVKEYVEANGITLGKNGMLLKATNESWDEKETLAVGQDALVAYGVVSVTNSEGVAVDRVRVRVNKRVPTFFVNVLGDFSDGFVVVAKAAAEGEGEEIEITDVQGPGLISLSDKLYIYTTQVRGRGGNQGNGLKTDIYVEGDLFAEAAQGGKHLKMHGDVYTQNPISDVNIKFDKGYKNQIIGENKIIKSKVEAIGKECNEIAKSTNLKNYTYFGGTSEALKPYSNNENYAIIDDSFFEGKSDIGNIVIDATDYAGVILNTSKKVFGNVYIKGNGFIEGQNNEFTGRIYATESLNVMGNDNLYRQLLGKPLRVGYGFDGDGKLGKVDSNSWKWRLDPPPSFDSSGGSGSGSSGSTTTGKLRLVE